MNKLNLDYFEIGEKYPAVLLLHGWGMSKECFKKLVPKIKPNQKIIGLDFFGFGNSSMPPEYFDTYEYAYMVFIFLKRKNIYSNILVGHSFGGRVCIILGSIFDSGCKKILLTSSAGINRFSPLKSIKIINYKIVKKLCSVGFLNAKILKKFGSSDYKNLNEIMQGVFVKVVNQDLKYLLKNISVLTNLVWDKSDKETPYSICKILNKNIDMSNIFIFKNGGHFTFLYNLNKFSNILNGIIYSC